MLKNGSNTWSGWEILWNINTFDHNTQSSWKVVPILDLVECQLIEGVAASRTFDRQQDQGLPAAHSPNCRPICRPQIVTPDFARNIHGIYLNQNFSTSENIFTIFQTTFAKFKQSSKLTSNLSHSRVLVFSVGIYTHCKVLQYCFKYLRTVDRTEKSQCTIILSHKNLTLERPAVELQTLLGLKISNCEDFTKQQAAHTFHIRNGPSIVRINLAKNWALFYWSSGKNCQFLATIFQTMSLMTSSRTLDSFESGEPLSERPWSSISATSLFCLLRQSE